MAEYRAAGLTHIELGWAPPSAGAGLADALLQSGGTFLIHNYFPQPDVPFVLNLASQDADLLRRSRAMAVDALRLTRALRAPFYSVHAGFLAEFDPASLGRTLTHGGVVPRDIAMATFAESLALLADEARVLDVALLIEPNVVDRRNLVDGENRLLLLAEAEEICSLFQRISRPQLGILLDTGHLNVSATTLGFHRMAFVDAVAGWIRAFHVHDNDGSSDQHRPVVAGSWVWEVLRRPAFRALPVVLEAGFDSIESLAAHWQWFLKECNDT